MNRNSNDAGHEIDLFDLFWLLWKEKRLLVIVTTLSMIVGMIPVFINDPYQRAKVLIKRDMVPPFTTTEAVNKDFETLFYTAGVFSKWEIDNSPKYLNKDVINETNRVDEFDYGVEPKVRAIQLSKGYLSIRAEKPGLFFEVADYASFVNAELTDIYRREVQARVNDRARVLKGYLPSNIPSETNLFFDNPFFHSVEDFNQYLRYVEGGRLTFKISRPILVPQKKLSILARLTILGVAGIVLGILIVLLRRVYRSGLARMAN